ncbi:MAG: hypothetical protein ABR585_03515 [Gemmatimonadaceae bacterium]
MAAYRISTFFAVALAIGAQPALAQAGRSSFSHVVSVTVPPRVKVQVAAIQQPHVALSSSASPSGISLSVNATQAWVLSIGSRNRAKVQWSRQGDNGFAGLAGENTTVASGPGLSNTSTSLFFRDRGAESATGADAAVVLSVVAP